jgi:hypothetical protein
VTVRQVEQKIIRRAVWDVLNPLLDMLDDGRLVLPLNDSANDAARYLRQLRALVSDAYDVPVACFPGWETVLS